MRDTGAERLKPSGFKRPVPTRQQSGEAPVSFWVHVLARADSALKALFFEN
jgi:hypothetical protein